jgi:hypothetical protein
MTVCDLRPTRLSGAPGQPAPNALVAIDAQSRPLIEKVIGTLLAYD